MLAKCKPLNDYATYIERIKANIKQGLSKKEAVDEAMEFAIKSNMLNGFFLFLLAHSSFANAKLAAKVTRTGYY